ncbi:hypothetical protein [Spirulina sp. 06S082]|uniref:hypothetical protein n=1 Tax=Spirulina sp. 06S082 TaxID=3110248 RepID=UPI002B21139C|nr:hypothetical protein [Spirulina sp. 06S082]MEA5469180.1 hypothetical protein [Spirulina sp. 06S082]
MKFAKGAIATRISDLRSIDIFLNDPLVPSSPKKCSLLLEIRESRNVDVTIFEMGRDRASVAKLYYIKIKRYL